MLKLFGDSYDVDTWADTLTTAVTQIRYDANDHKSITEIEGPKRRY